MRRYQLNRQTFSPCGSCAAGEVLGESGSCAKSDFGFALKELKRRDEGFDDSGRQIPISLEDVVEVARLCDLIDKTTETDLSPQLAACYEAQQNGSCTLGKPTEVKITGAIL